MAKKKETQQLDLKVRDGDFADYSAFAWCDKPAKTIIHVNAEPQHDEFVCLVLAFCIGALLTSAIAMHFAIL